MNIPALAEADLGDTMEGEFGIPVTLISPEGNRIDQSLNGGRLRGKVRWSQPEVSAEGETVVVYNPVVILRRSSLVRVPATGESWGVIIPDGPREDAADALYVLDKSYAVSGGQTLGKVRLPLVKAKDRG